MGVPPPALWSGPYPDTLAGAARRREGPVLARIWRGATRAADAEAYAADRGGTGGEALATTPGSRGVYMLRRVEGDRAEWIMLSLWEDEDAVRAFAGDDISVAVFYPEDERYLVERDLAVSHYEVVDRWGPIADR
jgi:heme-degrading monooxygenase HmoA